MQRYYATKIIHGDNGTVKVIQRRRRVTLHVDGSYGKESARACINLSPDAIDKLIARLHNIRASTDHRHLKDPRRKTPILYGK